MPPASYARVTAHAVSRRVPLACTVSDRIPEPPASSEQSPALLEEAIRAQLVFEPRLAGWSPMVARSGRKIVQARPARGDLRPMRSRRRQADPPTRWRVGLSLFDPSSHGQPERLVRDWVAGIQRSPMLAHGSTWPHPAEGRRERVAFAIDTKNRDDRARGEHRPAPDPPLHTEDLR